MINKNYNDSNRPSILVNYYKNPDYINIKSAYVGNKAGTKYDVVDFFDIDTASLRGVSKENLDFIKIFNNGINISVNDLDYNTWSGLIFIDIDSKICWENGCIDDEGNKYSIDDVEDSLNEHLINNYDDNYIGLQRSASGKSWHLFFYFDVENIGLEKSKDTFFAVSNVIFNSLKKLFSQIKTFDNRLSFDCFLKDKVLDTCSKRPTQPCYISGYDFKYNYLNPTGTCQDDLLRNKIFNEFDVIIKKNEEIEIDNKTIKEEFKLKGTLKIKDNISKDGFEWSYVDRFNLICALYTVFNGDYNNSLTFYEHCYNLFLEHANDSTHNPKTFKNDFDRAWNNCTSNTYGKREYIDFIKKYTNIKSKTSIEFRCRNIDDFKYDKVYELNDNEYLSSVFNNIINLPYNCIHVEAGCGLGKTHSAIDYTGSGELETFDFLFNKYNSRLKRICFITPMTSINRGNFTDLDNWVIIDSEHKGNYQVFSNKEDDNKVTSKSICTTWDSFIRYKFYEYDFDVFIFDEIHSLYLYDYRIDIIGEIKKTITELTKNNKVLLFSGTPSYERGEFNSYNVLVSKKVKEIQAKIIGYENNYTGWLIKDIKEWTEADENNIAYVFRNDFNENSIEWFKNRQIIVDFVYCKKNDEVVRYVNKEKKVLGKVILFSVYGQAGINIYAENNQKVRIYVLDKNSMGIIQYLNRLRNKENCDSVYIPLKKSEISNKYKSFEELKKENFDSIIEDEIASINTYNLSLINNEQICKIKEGYITTEFKKDAISRKIHVSKYILDMYEDGSLSINKEKQITNTYIQISNMYEKQTSVLYKRLTDNYFNVEYVELPEDIKDNVGTKKCGSNFFGAINKFNIDIDVKSNKNGELYLNKESKIYRFSTGDTVDYMEYVLNFLNSKNIDIQQTFNTINKKLVEQYNTITQSNIKRLAKGCKLIESLDKLYNGIYLHWLSDPNFDIVKIIETYCATTYIKIKEDKTKKIKEWNLDQFIYDTRDEMTELRKILIDYPMLIDINKVNKDYKKHEKYNEETAKEVILRVRKLLGNKYGKNNSKQIKVTFDDGKTQIFNSQDECAKTLGINNRTIIRCLSKNGYIKKLKCKIENYK